MTRSETEVDERYLHHGVPIPPRASPKYRYDRHNRTLSVTLIGVSKCPF
jgi:hypothetical protein